jgi:hypothetical protein
MKIGLVFLLAVVLVAAGCDIFTRKQRAQEELLVLANQAVSAQEMFFENAPGRLPRYATSVEELTAFMPGLTADPTVTFTFARRRLDAYSLTLQRNGEKWYVRCEADSDCRVVEPD